MVLLFQLERTTNIPLVVEAPSLTINRTVQTYHQILRDTFYQKISELGVSPKNFDELAVFESALYPEMTFYYQNIAELLTPAFKADELTPQSRFALFIATTPHSHADYKQPILGLSGIEQLLGLTRPTVEEVESRKSKVGSEERITSGDIEIDLLAELILAFGGSDALTLSRTYSIEYLSKLVSQYSLRSNKVNAAAGGVGSSTTRTQQELDRQAYEQNLKAIAQEFRDNGAGGIPFF